MGDQNSIETMTDARVHVGMRDPVSYSVVVAAMPEFWEMTNGATQLSKAG